MDNKKKSIDKIIALCKNRGFIYAGSEIYGGFANTWDYGNLGVELKNNIKKIWWKKFIVENKYNVGMDSAILMNPQTWVASGHLSGFSDPLIDCKSCKKRFRADNLIEDFIKDKDEYKNFKIESLSNEEMENFIVENNIKCPNCGKKDFTKIRKFNLMFKTFQGVTEDSKNIVYLRPETAQGIFVNFKNVQRTSRKKIPFGIGQIGKSFRNEITPGNFIFRTREFEQIELEFFCKPGTDLEWFDYWKKYCLDFLYFIGISKDNVKFKDHSKEELSFYSKATTDIQYLFPFGWGELWGIADRTDYDLNCHMKLSGKDLQYFDEEINQKYTPYVIEPSVGVDRLLLSLLCEAYDEEELEDKSTRIVMHFNKNIAPIKIAILPLTKNEKLIEKSTEIFNLLSKYFFCDYDVKGNIGRRYRRQDEIGTPYCVTYDFDSLDDNSVTIRDRDTMKQERISIDKLKDFFIENL